MKNEARPAAADLQKGAAQLMRRHYEERFNNTDIANQIWEVGYDREAKKSHLIKLFKKAHPFAALPNLIV